jgi:hypothetical protein
MASRVHVKGDVAPMSSKQLRRGERAAWGRWPDVAGRTAAERRRMRLLDFRAMRKGKLLGFARIELPIGLLISDIPILAGKNGVFAALPARPILDREGRRKRDVNGRPQYLAFLEWRDRNISGRFSAAVIELVRAAHPEALEDRS